MNTALKRSTNHQAYKPSFYLPCHEILIWFGVDTAAVMFMLAVMLWHWFAVAPMLGLMLGNWTFEDDTLVPLNVNSLE